MFLTVTLRDHETVTYYSIFDIKRVNWHTASLITGNYQT